MTTRTAQGILCLAGPVVFGFAFGAAGYATAWWTDGLAYAAMALGVAMTVGGVFSAAFDYRKGS